MSQYIGKIKKLSEKVLEILSSLDENQTKILSFDFNDDERFIWYYTPHKQNGLLVFDMKPYQRKLLFELLELTYSSKGYKTAFVVIFQVPGK